MSLLLSYLNTWALPSRMPGVMPCGGGAVGPRPTISASAPSSWSSWLSRGCTSITTCNTITVQYSTPQLSRIFVLGRFSQAPGHDFLLLLFLNKKIKRMQLEIYWIVVFMVIIRMHLLKVEVSVWCSLSRIL